MTNQTTILHDWASLSRYGYRQLKAALATLDKGPPGFDLFRDPRTKLKEDLARYIIQKHGAAAVTQLLPVRDAVEQVAGGGSSVGGQGHEGFGQSATSAQGSESGSGEGQSDGEQGEGDGEGEGDQTGEGDAQGEGEGQGEGESEGQQGEGQPQDGGEGDGDDGDAQQGNPFQPEEAKDQNENPFDRAIREKLNERLKAAGEAVQRELAKQQAKAEKAAKDAQKALEEAMKGGSQQTITVKRPGKPPVKVDGHKHPITDKVLALVEQGQNVLLKGPAGCGKTTLGNFVAKARQAPGFHRVPYTSGASESWILGRYLPTGENGRFEFHNSRVLAMHRDGGVVLHDEIDAGDGNMLLILNGVTDGGIFVNPLTGESMTKHADAVHIATANTFGTGSDAIYVGRNQLDGATLDRWYVVEMDYDTALEATLGPKHVVEWVWKLREAAQKARIQRVVGTRMIQKATAGLNAGLKWGEVQADMLSGWTRDEKQKCSV